MVRRSRPSVKYSIHAPTRRAGYRRDRYAVSAWPTAASPRAARRSTNPVSARRHQPARPAADPAAAARPALPPRSAGTPHRRAAPAPARPVAGPRRNRRPPAPPPSPAAALPAPRAARNPPPGTATPAGHESPAERARRRHERIFPERGQFHHIAFGQTVRGWQGDQHRLAQQGLEMQTRRADAGMAHEADVGASQFQRLDLLARGRLAQRERHGGMRRAETPQPAQQRFIGRNIDEGRRQVAFHALRHAPRLRHPSSSAASMRRAVSRNAAPAGVSVTLRLVRASKGAPTCASSRWIACSTAAAPCAGAGPRG